AAIGRVAIEARAIARRKRLETIQRALLVEHLRVGLQRGGAAEHAGRAAFGFLGGAAVRRGVSADEEARIPRVPGLAPPQDVAPPKPPAEQHSASLAVRRCGAVSVPMKKHVSPDVAALRSARR